MPARASVFAIVGMEKTDVAPYVIAPLVVNGPYSIANFFTLNAATIPDNLVWQPL
jgi:hypothetical protein